MSEYFSSPVGQGARSDLPAPDAEARRHSLRVTEAIRAELNRWGGRIPFDRFMEMALYAPGLGYYAAGSRKFGEAGDFVTAPEISPVFARCLARQCQQVLAELGAGDLLEFGAGSGRLGADLLAELQALGQLPRRYLILELSPELRARQQATIAARIPQLAERVHWLEHLPDEGFCGVILANELLDAMPVHRFRIADGRILEQFVAGQEEGFTTVWDTPDNQLLETVLADLTVQRDDYESEINLRAGPWIKALGDRFGAGLMLLIDYGYTGFEYYHPHRDRGTLMCHYRHRAHSDPLRYPGLQDITAHVDFSRLANAALEAGFSVAGYATQAFFLMGCGLDRLVAESDPDDVRNHLALVQGVKRLTLPSEMGERFKVLGLTKGIREPLIGFGMQNLWERL